MILVAVILQMRAADRTAEIFSPQNFPGKWTLQTNEDATITATEAAVHRQGNEVYQRVLSLGVVSGELMPSSEAATVSAIRDFISQYSPPDVPYTSEATAEKTGGEKFNCLEFAEDLVAKANAEKIPAEVIGIKFDGEMVGHACAGFPTAEGGMLYFDSTPAAGQVSRAAHEAWVKLGEPYRRADGGELAGGVENVPIEKIIPVNPLAEVAASVLVAPNTQGATPKATLIVENEMRVQVPGIDYAGPDTLQVSEGQLVKWQQASAKFLAERAVQEASQKQALQATLAKAAVKALQENQQLADQGDVYGQLRMGERYLTGDGVEKDLVRARKYLQLAADQGSPSAADDLKNLQGK
jgi:hypothetical protein